MIALSGEILLPDRLLSPGTIVLDAGRIVDVRQGETAGARSFRGHYVAPGFIDVHVHGVEGYDTLDAGDAIEAIAARLPRYGVTAFCPTTVACDPQALACVLNAVHGARANPPRGARVLAAHLESNFINPEYRGAQPLACLRLPPSSRIAESRTDGAFSGDEILAAIDAARGDVGIVTVAPELDGGIALVARLVANGHRVSLGHSAATYEQALEAIDAGARHATHLFNRMPPLHHRTPGLAGAVLSDDRVAAEIICDGHHVHPALIRAAVGAKTTSRIMAITDGTAGSGLAVGSITRLGGQTITVSPTAAVLDDGTLAGSVLTFDRAFKALVQAVSLSVVDASHLCSTTPARELGLEGQGRIEPGAAADIVVLDPGFQVVETYVGGEVVFSANS
jgi:N-acetylglucosamine-6-phosphate deacetylase